jgi:hypothetical protein
MVSLNVITFGSRETDNINRMITISEGINTCIMELMSEFGLGHFDNVNQMVSLNVITLGSRETDNINQMITISECIYACIM